MAAAPLRPVAWLPLILLPICAALFAPLVPPWMFMWLLAGSIFLGAKWLMLADAIRRGVAAPWKWRLAFLFLWPGMDATTFLGPGSAKRIRGGEWNFAAAKVGFGAALYWGVARLAGGGMLTAWIGMVGIIFLLHFGTFHLLSLAWRRAGVSAEPLMRNPAGAVSLGDFWSRRWNAAFNDIAERFVFRPLSRRRGVAAGTFGAFLFSGLLHDLVISVPAGGGYGLPTLYFLIQAAGVWLERSRLGRRMGLRRGLRGWLFTFFIAAAPVGFLFHPPFAQRIILPMMSATCAL